MGGAGSFFVLVRADGVCFNRAADLLDDSVCQRGKGAGGRGHPDAVAWSLPYEWSVSLGLASRMIAGTVPDDFGRQRESAPVDAFCVTLDKRWQNGKKG